jgi:hypothetical protein
MQFAKAVGEYELAFVVGAPQIIGQAWLGQAGALSLIAAFAPAPDQAFSQRLSLDRE